MADLTRLIQRVQHNRPGLQRMAAARAAFSSCTDEEKTALLEEWLAEMDTNEEPSVTSAMARGSANVIEPVSMTGSPSNGVPASTGVRKPVGTPGLSVSVVRDAIVGVMSDGKRRGTTAISQAVAEQYPSVNVASIPSAVARMVNMEPPMLIKRGKSDRGHPLYVLAPAMMGTTATPTTTPSGEG